MHLSFFLFAIQCCIDSYYSNKNVDNGSSNSSSKNNNGSPSQKSFTCSLTITPKAPRSGIPTVNLREETNPKTRKKIKAYNKVPSNLMIKVEQI